MSIEPESITEIIEHTSEATKPPTIRATAKLLMYLLFKWGKTEGSKLTTWFCRVIIFLVMSGTSTGVFLMRMLTTGLINKWEQARGYFIHPNRNSI